MSADVLNSSMIETGPGELAQLNAQVSNLFKELCFSGVARKRDTRHHHTGLRQQWRKVGQGHVVEAQRQDGK